MAGSSVASPPSSSPSSSSNPSDQLHMSITTTTAVSAEEQASLELRARKRRDYEKFKHYASVGAIFLAPTLMLMPPRKLDLYTVALAGGFVAGASQLSRERYGVGLVDLVGQQVTMHFQQDLQQQEVTRREDKGDWKWSSSMPTERAKDLQRQIRQSKGEESQEEQSLFKRLWMGGEKENWKEERAKEHAEALERGETIGDLIRTQINEVWNRGQKSAEDLEQKDKEVLAKHEKDK